MKWTVRAIAVAALMVPAVALAASGGGTTVTLPKSETHNGTYYAAAQNVEVDGNVNGDLVCAGQTVTVNGTVTGDVICGGQDVTINGPVGGSVRVAGQTVNLNNTVGRNVTVMGQNVMLSSQAAVSGEVAAAGQTVTINGPVAHVVDVAAQEFALGSTVGGDVNARIGDVNLGQDASVNGDFTYTNADVLAVDKSKVHGTVTHNLPPQNEAHTHSSGGALVGLWFGGLVYWVLAALAGMLLAVWLLPRFVRGVTDQMVKRPWAAVGWGFVAVMAGPIVLVLVAITVLGLPLAFVLGSLWFLALVVSGGVAGVAAGRLLLRHKTTDQRNLAMAALAGVPLTVLIIWLPALGIVAGLAAAWWAVGGMLLMLVRLRSLA